MENTNLKSLSMEEMVVINGGVSWRCLGLAGASILLLASPGFEEFGVAGAELAYYECSQ